MIKTEKTQHVPYLDGWRGVAIILVLIAHFSPGYRLLPIGSLGVLLFFVLSGHFMGGLLFVKKTPLPTFFARRFSRIIPLTWFYISVMYIYARYLMPDTYVPPTEELVSTFVFLGAYLPADISVWAGKWPTGQLWSLNVEEHSYLFLGLVSIFISKFKSAAPKKMVLWGAVVLVLATTILYSVGLIHAGASPWRTHTEVASLGLLTAACLAAFPSSNKTWWNTASWVPLLLLAVTALSFVSHAFFIFSLTVSPLLAAGAVHYAHNFPMAVKNGLSNSIVRWFGRVSFSIYIWQQPFFELSHQHGMPLVAGLILSIAVGALSFYLFENPARMYLNEQWNRFEQRRSQAAAM
jgi:peptidoglycan/LPS O-acetylase OafA/YrhL